MHLNKQPYNIAFPSNTSQTFILISTINHMCDAHVFSVCTSCVRLSCGWLYTLGRAIHIRKILCLHGYFCNKMCSFKHSFPDYQQSTANYTHSY